MRTGRTYRAAALLLALAPLLAAAASPARADNDSDRAFEAVRQGEIAPLADILIKVQEMYGGRVLEVELEEEKLDPADAAATEMDNEEAISDQETTPGSATGNRPAPTEAAEGPSDPRFQTAGRYKNDPGQAVMYYEIKLLTDDGYVLKLKFDARSSDLLSVAGHDEKKKDDDKKGSILDRLLDFVK